MLSEDLDLELEFSDFLERDPTGIAQLEEAALKADAANDLRRGFAVRMQLTEAASSGGRPELVVLSFTWCLSRLDTHPQWFESELWDVLWQYKWLLPRLTYFSSVSRSQINEALDDFAARLQRGDYSQRTEFDCREKVARIMGDLREAEYCHEQKLRCPRDSLSDCVTCERRGDVSRMVELGKDREAIALAEPILAGRWTCVSEPEATMANTLCALVRIGRREEARLNHLRTYRRIRDDRGSLDHICEPINYLILTGELASALAIFERHLPWAFETRDEHERKEFYFAGRRLLMEMTVGQAHTFIRVPQELMESAELQISDVAHVLDWLDRQCHDLAARFDRRNGNDACMKALKE